MAPRLVPSVCPSSERPTGAVAEQALVVTEQALMELELEAAAEAADCGLQRQLSSPAPPRAPECSPEAAAVAEEVVEAGTAGVPLKEALSDPVLAMHRARKKKQMPCVQSLPVLETEIKASWPQSLVEILRSAPKEQYHHQEALGASPAQQGLRLASGTSQIPHPRKAASGGEDSLFVCPHGSAVGVADGVGEWEWRFGLNPRAFADELMMGACAAAARTRFDADLSAKDRSERLLEEGYAASASFGSSTAVVVALDAAGSTLGVANIGDSGVRHIRWLPSSHTSVGGARVVNRTVDQQHEFNCPFQLSRLPGPADFDRLRAEGKEKLVRAVEKAPSSRQDMPHDADLYALEVQEGDLILLGSDGVFDNLHDHEVCHLLDMVVPPLDVQCSSRGDGFTDPMNIAQAVAQAARCRSLDTSAKTPFSQNAAQAGLYHIGGKVDDVTVIAAWVIKPSK